MNRIRERARARLFDEIRTEFRGTQHLTGLADPDPAVLAAMERVPRERFVPPGHIHEAYVNRPLRIGLGQTISQPFIVALMTTLLRPRPNQTILEIGTGSGYQAAVLSELVAKVYSIEILPDLATSAGMTLQGMGYENVVVACRDGSSGWPEHAPFDGIIVTAACGSVPAALREQLAPGGRMVIPIDEGLAAQKLMLIERGRDGIDHESPVLGVVFVPLTHPRSELERRVP